MDLEQRIKEIEEEIRTTPHHKGTELHLGKLRARIAKLKDEYWQKVIKSGKHGGGTGYAVKKSGDATIALIGPPSVGKSTLINRLTNTQSKVADYDFTTLSVVPGMMDYQGAKIQIFDLPGIIGGAAKGKGRGKEVLSVTRNCDLIVIMVDVNTVGFINQIKDELTNFGVRLDQSPPNIMVTKTISGGIKVYCSIHLNFLNFTLIKEVATEFRIRNAEIIVKEDLTVDRLIDGLMINRVYVPYLIIINKVDLINRTNDRYLSISAKNNMGLEILKEAIWEKLNLMQIYLKKDQHADFKQPLIVKKGMTVKQAAKQISLELAENIKSAQVWGKSAKFPAQTVSLNHILLDQDIVFFVK